MYVYKYIQLSLLTFHQIQYYNPNPNCGTYYLIMHTWTTIITFQPKALLVNGAPSKIVPLAVISVWFCNNSICGPANAKCMSMKRGNQPKQPSQKCRFAPKPLTFHMVYCADGIVHMVYCAHQELMFSSTKTGHLGRLGDPASSELQAPSAKHLCAAHLPEQGYATCAAGEISIKITVQPQLQLLVVGGFNPHEEYQPTNQPIGSKW